MHDSTSMLPVNHNYNSVESMKMDFEMIPLQKVKVAHVASAVTPSAPAIKPIISPVHETDLSKGVEKCTTDTIHKCTTDTIH